MMLGPQWRQVKKLFHFTDRQNLPSIREQGGLWSLSQLKEKRVEIPMPGGNEWSHDADVRKGMDKYVHLCFTEEHPMEYCAKLDGRINDPVYLRIDASVIEQTGVCFSQDVSNKSGVPILPLDEATKIIDFDVLYTYLDWAHSDVQARRQAAKKYEILIPNHVPLELIRIPNG